MTLSAPVSEMFVEDHAVAVLIDGENIAASHAQTILKQARQQGVPRIRRVYGDAALLKGWDAEPEVDLIHTRCGKNSADMKLAIDAVDLAARGLTRRFVIVSSDGDFTHLARHLCERGHRVTGMGGVQTPEAFQRACGWFVTLEALTDRIESEAGQTSLPLRPTELTTVLAGLPLHKAVAEILRRESGTSWIEVASLNGMVRRHIGMRITACPEKSWNGFLTKYGNMFQCDGKGAARRVRLRVPL
ncbi:NYN domain-containing protein [Sedimentitalea sp. JM2-8]|uniref:NYN domain-containing protein n=1 Tax=Sedimentitalea xiamensis TaxID=3050037 RepID=A0ABT7FDH2_9RHOB|nr:NYN domain-containing protein [Sedimentitalea xiamensis]MDK3073168.1 NYN domain-containing protein [Sedimentitalea xiamensis]